MDNGKPSLESFVSVDASELLSQFSSKRSEQEIVHVHIYSSGDLAALRQRVLERLATTVGNHGWWDPEALCDMRIEEGCLATQVEFRDGDDEWLCVAALLDVTTCERDALIRVVDDDGDFLLIEAAESLPDWLDPDLSDHRAWLYRGAVCVVLDDPGHPISLSRALEAAPKSRNNRSSRAATAALSRRIRFDLYDSPTSFFFEPAGKLATIRKVRLPVKLAKAFVGRPRLVSLAARHAKSTRNTTSTEVPLKFSRATYARLAHDFEDVGNALAGGFYRAVSRQTKLGGIPLEQFLTMPSVLPHAEDLVPPAEDGDLSIDREKLEAELEAMQLPDKVVQNVDDFFHDDDDPVEDTVHADGVLHVLGGDHSSSSAERMKKIVIVEEEEASSSDTEEEDGSFYPEGGEEEELAETEMAKSFCRFSKQKGNLDPLDIDYNLVKSLLDSLEAASSEKDQSGPADLFLYS